MTAVTLSRAAPFNRPLSGAAYDAEILRGYRGRNASSILYGDNLWIQAQQVPLLQLDFTTGSIRNTVGLRQTPTFTRPSSVKTLWTGSGFTDYPADVPGFGIDPLTGRWGYCHEPAATNLFLNNGAPATQVITVAATSHVLSFYGSGTITLSGVATGTLVGTGTNNRVHLAFTPTAGVLVVTVSGEVILPQVETGVVAPSSPIRTSGSAVTRAADTMTIGGADFTAIWNPLGGVLYAETATTLPTACGIFGVDDTTANERFRVGRSGGTTGAAVTVDGGVVQANLSSSGLSVTGTAKIAARFAASNFGVSSNGTAETASATGTIPTPTQFTVGTVISIASFQGFMFKTAYFAPGGNAQSRLALMTT